MEQQQKIRGFARFEPGWHYGEGVRFDKARLNKAICLNDEAIRRGFVQTDAFPGVSGEVMITIYHGRHYLEFSIEPDDTVVFVYEFDDEEVTYEEGLDFDAALAKIEAFRRQPLSS